MNNCITNFLGIKDIEISFLKEFKDSITIDIETAPKEQPCPCCGSKESTIHDYRIQKVKDLPYRGKVVILLLRKRRYRCSECGKRYMEKYDFLPRYRHRTQRVYEFILRALRSNRSMKSVAEEYSVSSNTISRVFDIVSYSLHKLPSVLAIDEFKGNSGGEKYHAILTDPSRKKLLDIVFSREKLNLSSYFRAFTHREQVKIVIMDMLGTLQRLS